MNCSFQHGSFSGLASVRFSYVVCPPPSLPLSIGLWASCWPSLAAPLPSPLPSLELRPCAGHSCVSKWQTEFVFKHSNVSLAHDVAHALIFPGVMSASHKNRIREKIVHTHSHTHTLANLPNCHALNYFVCFSTKRKKPK